MEGMNLDDGNRANETFACGGTEGAELANCILLTNLNSMFSVQARDDIKGTLWTMIILLSLVLLHVLCSLHDYVFLVYLERHERTKPKAQERPTERNQTVAGGNRPASLFRKRFRRSAFFFNVHANGAGEQSEDIVFLGDEADQQQRPLQRWNPHSMHARPKSRISIKAQDHRGSFTNVSGDVIKGNSVIVGIDLRDEDPEAEEPVNINDADLEDRRRKWWLQRQQKLERQRKDSNNHFERSAYATFLSTYGFRRSALNSISLDHANHIVVEAGNSSGAGNARSQEVLHPRVMEALLKSERESVFCKTRSKVFTKSVYIDVSVDPANQIEPVRPQVNKRQSNIIWDPTQTDADGFIAARAEALPQPPRRGSVYLDWAKRRLSNWEGVNNFGYDPYYHPHANHANPPSTATVSDRFLSPAQIPKREVFPRRLDTAQFNGVKLIDRKDLEAERQRRMTRAEEESRRSRSKSRTRSTAGPNDSRLATTSTSAPTNSVLPAPPENELIMPPKWTNSPHSSLTRGQGSGSGFVISGDTPVLATLSLSRQRAPLGGDVTRSASQKSNEVRRNAEEALATAMEIRMRTLGKYSVQSSRDEEEDSGAGSAAVIRVGSTTEQEGSGDGVGYGRHSYDSASLTSLKEDTDHDEHDDEIRKHHLSQIMILESNK
ncbi:hypothetical protein HDU97_009659 [Phlyctochytrium planicorne]|nr:hypothetical protein HDU97_009659 [Phlyctochytrium planicorne]